MTELIIVEKPAAAFKVAIALADNKAEKHSEKGVPYYTLTHKNKEILVVCAVGHLYGIEEKDKSKGFKFPVFEIEWKPSYEITKGHYSKKYLNLIKKLSNQAKEFTVACDYDVEGEVIGLNIVRFACNQKDAARMKFSTLTKPDLREAYENKANTLNWGQAKAGETRHELDWYWGINTSRALTSAIKACGMFKILSSGRVQGPALKIIVDREKEIKAFKPIPFWQIELKGTVKQGNIIAWHKEDKFWEKEKADKVMENVKGQEQGTIIEIEKTQFKQNPPTPFDLTTLQVEAYRCFKIAPKDTLAIAQELYLAGLISYPRTSSQQLPPILGYQRILNKIGQQEKYKNLCSSLLDKPDLRPNNGKKTDPAHPACHPTGEISKHISQKQAKIYDLVVKRTLACFADPATRETVKINIDVNGEIFISKGTRTIEKGWHIYYSPYVKLEEEELPAVNKGDIVDIKEINCIKKETQPPKRYTPASIVKELAKRNLGTKSTRATIVDTLFQRGYVHGKMIEATELGIHTVETLEKYCPLIVDEKLTRHFEEEMEEISENKKEEQGVLKEARELLIDVLQDFKKKQKEIGEGLKKANIGSVKKARTVGKCPVCGEGDLVIRKGKFGRFIACNKYPDCKTTFNLPNTGSVKTSKNICPKCNHPMITILRKGKKAQELCINQDCPSKQIDEKSIEEKPCPKCKEGKLVLRKSVYGSFLACNRFPKCRYTEKINNS